jgi:hypothetical protein
MADPVVVPAVPTVVLNFCANHHDAVAAEGLKTSECIACIREERDRLRDLVGLISSRLENLTNEWRIARKVPKP